MNKIQVLLRVVMLAGLLLLLVSCTQISQAPGSATPTVDSAHLTAFAQPYPTYPPLPTPTPSPTPLGGASARLGPVPQGCPSRPAPKNVVSNTGPAVGAFPVWTVGLSGPHATLEWSPKEAMEFHHPDGWAHKFLWVVDSSVKGLVTIHGANLGDGSPLLPSAEQDVATSTPTMLILDPQDPMITNRVDPWVEFPGGLDIPRAGCYYLEATWPGGSWRITFAAGVVPSNG